MSALSPVIDGYVEEEWRGIDDSPPQMLRVYRVRLVDGLETWALYRSWGEWRRWSGESTTLSEPLDAIAWRHARERELTDPFCSSPGRQLQMMENNERTGEAPALSLPLDNLPSLEQRAPRVPIKLPVLLVDSVATTTAVSSNISESGMFVEMTDSPPAPGSIVTFSMELRKIQLRGLGKVVWTRVNPTDTLGRSSGLAIAFIAVRDSSRLRKELQRLGSVVGSLQS